MVCKTPVCIQDKLRLIAKNKEDLELESQRTGVWEGHGRGGEGKKEAKDIQSFVLFEGKM